MREVYHKWLLVLLGSVIAFGVGYFVGFANGIRFVIIEGIRFLERQGVNFNATAIDIANLINKYLGIVASGQGI